MDTYAIVLSHGKIMVSLGTMHSSNSSYIAVMATWKWGTILFFSSISSLGMFLKENMHAVKYSSSQILRHSNKYVIFSLKKLSVRIEEIAAMITTSVIFHVDILRNTLLEFIQYDVAFICRIIHCIQRRKKNLSCIHFIFYVLLCN